MAEAKGCHWYTPTGMKPLFYTHDSGEDEIELEDDREDENDTHFQQDEDNLVTEITTEDDEKMVSRFKQGLKEAGRDKQAKDLWLARHATAPCTTCKCADECQRKDDKVGCIPCKTAHRRCSTTKSYVLEYAAACADVPIEKGKVLYETYGTTKRMGRPRKKQVKREEMDDAPDMMNADFEQEQSTHSNSRGQKRKRTMESAESAFANADSNILASPSRAIPARESRELFTPSLLLNFPASVIPHPHLKTSGYIGMSPTPRTSPSPPETLGFATSLSPATQLRNNTERRNTQYDTLKESRDKLRTEKISHEAEALRKETEKRELTDGGKQLDEYRRRQIEDSTSGIEVSRPTGGDSQGRAQLLETYLTIQQRNHMRLSARVGQVELMLRRIVNPGSATVHENNDALLKMALEELSSCLHDDMGSRMEHWNPFNNSGMVFRPERVSFPISSGAARRGGMEELEMQPRPGNDARDNEHEMHPELYTRSREWRSR
ncbi:hypothetical protein FPV67DRAFT_720741 [Lyophyllum atratum]|nr:hypothetical protein FPV67DRAFT_720741 [Lyophyllum atratum]